MTEHRRTGTHTAPLVVIVTGPPGTGKTWLARRLGPDLRLPLLCKDDIKESLFNSLGWSDREWSRKLGRASIELLYLLMEKQLAAGCSLLVEANFDPHLATGRFLDLKQRYGFYPVQLNCRADGPTLLERYRVRVASGERHPGHGDHETYSDVQAVLARGYLDPLDIGGLCITLDTTDPQAIDYPGLLAEIKEAARRT